MQHTDFVLVSHRLMSVITTGKACLVRVHCLSGRAKGSTGEDRIIQVSLSKFELVRARELLRGTQRSWFENQWSAAPAEERSRRLWGRRPAVVRVGVGV